MTNIVNRPARLPRQLFPLTRKITGKVKLSPSSAMVRDQERDDLSSNRHRALSFCLSMIFPENRFPLFRIML